MASQALSSGATRLVERLDTAVSAPSIEATVVRVKTALEQACRDGELVLPERFRQTRPDHYARRLLHQDRRLGYTAVVMSWGPDQRTGLHDHAGIWCVEVVVEGAMTVVQYDLVEAAGDTYRFARQRAVTATVGSAGSLIPPFEYHVLANALRNATSITLHVYGGEMNTCGLYEPRPDGSYTRRARTLAYDEP